MLQSVDIGTQSVDAYRTSAGDETVEMLRTLADAARGASCMSPRRRMAVGLPRCCALRFRCYGDLGA